LSELSRRLAESQAHEAELQRKVDELNNRLFIVQDQLEARTPAPQRAIAVRPGASEPSADRAATRSATDDDVEYVGAARDAHAPRPVLRVIGSSMPSSGGHAKTQGSEVVGEAAGPAPRGSGNRGAARPATGGGSGALVENAGDRMPITRNVPPVPSG